jgi:hypothetical protein
MPQPQSGMGGAPGGMPGGMMGAPVPGGMPGGMPGPGQQQLAAAQAAMAAQRAGAGGMPPAPGMGMGYARGGGVSTFNSTQGGPGNLPARPGKARLAKGGVLRRRPAARKKESPRQAPPTPIYDTPAAGDGGQPPTPNFTGAPGPNMPGPGMMAAGGAVEHGKNCKCADCAKRIGGAIRKAKGGDWIAGAIKHPGALHKQLGVPQGEKIPAKKLAKAAQAGGKLGERARLAQTLKGFKKAKGGDCDKMAAGGAAKVRRGFPDTNPAPKKLAAGGQVRGAGAAQRGVRFSGIY